MTSDQVPIEHPFPGMRSFRVSESQLFRGQGEQVDAVVSRLDHSRFVAVLGESGCGKSSLVRAGVIPELTGTDPRWRDRLWTIIVTEPNEAPLRNLAEALGSVIARPPVTIEQALSALGNPPRTEDEALCRPTHLPATVEDALRQNSHRLVELLLSTLGSDRQILIVVDQFEELFAFRRESDPIKRTGLMDDALQFVAMLLTASRTEDASIYVMLTMRSECLGDCALLPGLAEAINDGAYLLPKMTRFQLEQAILEPLAMVKGAIDHRLLQRLLQEAATSDQDGLPLLQYTLRKLWECWNRRGRLGEISFEHLEFASEAYQIERESTSSWSEAGPPPDLHLLSSQFDDGLELIWEEMGSDEKTATVLLTLLGEYSYQGREVRTSTSVADLMAISAAEQSSILRVIGRFTNEHSGRYFLQTAGRQIQVSHEVMLRRWIRFRRLLRGEAKDAWFVRELGSRARRARQVKLAGGDLSEALQLVARHEPFEPWASRHLGAGEATDVLTYIRKSRNRQRVWRAAAMFGAAIALVAIFVITDVRIQLSASEAREQEMAKANERAETAAASAEQARAAEAAASRALRTRNDELLIINQMLHAALNDESRAHSKSDEGLKNCIDVNLAALERSQRDSERIGELTKVMLDQFRRQAESLMPSK